MYKKNQGFAYQAYPMADAAVSQETFLTALSEKLLDNAKLILSTAVGGLLEYAGHAPQLWLAANHRGQKGTVRPGHARVIEFEILAGWLLGLKNFRWVDYSG